MREFFKPWRRKVGVLTLVMAFGLAAAWVREEIKGVRHEWRCPREFCVFATVNCHDRAALKNAILRVHEFQDSFPRAGMA